MAAAETLAAPPPGAPVVDSQADRLAFLAFVEDDASETALRGGLVNVLGSPEIRRGGIEAATRALEREDSPRILLVDIAAAPDPLAALEGLARVCAPDVEVVVIGERSDVDFYRDVTRGLGAAEYLPKPLTRDRVLNLISPQVTGAGLATGTPRGGRVVVVCGAKGGAGATTVAVNLAVQLAETTRGHIALVDAHLRGGHAAMLLGVRTGSGLRHALESPDRIDSLFIDRIALQIGPRLRLIGAEEPLAAEPAPTAAGMARLLDLLARRFNTIVVDLPMPPGPMERQVLALARPALVVFGPDIAGVRDAEAARGLIGQLAGAGRALTVLNRAGMPGALSLDLVREGLGGPPDILLPDLPQDMARAANLGKPALAESAAFRRALAPLAQEVSGIGQARRGGLLRRLLGR